MATTIATAEASFMVIADCEACSHPYHWTVVIEHKEYSGFLRRIKDPRGGLAMKLMTQGIPMLKPCPKCGYTQSYMRPTWEKQVRLNWILPAILVVIGLFLLWGGTEQKDPSARNGFMIGGLVTALLAVPSGLLITKELNAGPNRKWHKKHGSEVPAKKDVRVEPTTSGMTVCPSCRQQTKGKLNRARVPIIVLFCALPIVCMGLRLIPWEGLIVWMLLAGLGAFGCLVQSRRIKAFWPSVTCEHCRHTWTGEC